MNRDQILLDILDAWKAWDDNDGYFGGDRDSESGMRSGLPLGVSDFITLSNINYLSLYIWPYNLTSYLSTLYINYTL